MYLTTSASIPAFFISPFPSDGLTVELLRQMLLDVAMSLPRRPGRGWRDFEQPVFLAAAQLIPGVSMHEAYWGARVLGYHYGAKPGSGERTERPVSCCISHLRYRGRQFDFDGLVSDASLRQTAHARLLAAVHQQDPMGEVFMKDEAEFYQVDPTKRRLANHPARDALQAAFDARKLAEQRCPALPGKAGVRL